MPGVSHALGGSLGVGYLSNTTTRWHRPLMLATVLLIGLMASPVASAQAPSNRASAAAREMTQTIGSNSPSIQILEQLRDRLIAGVIRNTRKPVEEAGALVDGMLMPEFTAHAGELDDTIIDIYASNYSADDMRALRQFYLTLLGRRILKAAPAIGEQSFAAGQSWGAKAAREAIGNHSDALQERGVVL